MKSFFTIFFSSIAMVAYTQNNPHLLVGTYTGGKSKGVYVYRFNTDGSAELVDSAITVNPSYLAISPDNEFVYAVNEIGAKEGGGTVSAYRFNKENGKLTALNKVSSMGEHPCFISVDKTGRWVIVGNYSSGNVAVLPVHEDGSLGTAVSTVQHYGKGLTERQEKPHVHATVLSNDNRMLVVPDLGIDKLMVYHFNAERGLLTIKDSSLSLPPGSGPRHFDWHPSGKWGYLLQELSGNVTFYRYKKGTLIPQQTISMIPAGFSQTFTSADIHVSPNGKFLFTSTRDASNTLAAFSINNKNGKLTLLGHQSTLGKTPRNFSFDPTGNFLLTANQNSDEIVVFRIDQNTSELTDTGNRVEVGKPVCLKWVPK